MVAQVTLTHPVLVRIQAGQPFDARLCACSWPAAGSAEAKEPQKSVLTTRRMAPSKLEVPSLSRDEARRGTMARTSQLLACRSAHPDSLSCVLSRFEGPQRVAKRSPGIFQAKEEVNQLTPHQVSPGRRRAKLYALQHPIQTARSMAPRLSRGIAFVYFLRLHSGSIYVGCTIDLEQRLADHQDGVACYTTKQDPPIDLLRLGGCSDFAAARQREAQLKKWSGQKKEALVRGNLAQLRELARSHD
jgi:putative endonuclease